MSKYVSIVFCNRCNSRYVEIEEWDEPEKKVIFHCRTCGTSETLSNFTLGRCNIPDKDFQIAWETRAIPFKPER